MSSYEQEIEGRSINRLIDNVTPLVGNRETEETQGQKTLREAV